MSRLNANFVSYADFLRWEGENQHVEWVNGDVIPLPPVTSDHNELTGWLMTLISIYTERACPSTVRMRPFQMKPGPGLPGRAPDIQVVRDEHRGRCKTYFTDGPADLVIEVSDPESRDVDRGAKLDEYEKGAVPEYWILDIDQRQHRFYQLSSGGRYERVNARTDRVYRSRAIDGLWLDVSWIWNEPRPFIISILKQWGIV